jgi:hypothetical protein
MHVKHTISYSSIHNISRLGTNGISIETDQEDIRLRFYLSRDSAFRLLRSLWVAAEQAEHFDEIISGLAASKQNGSFGAVSWKWRYCVLGSKYLSEYKHKGDQFPVIVTPVDAMYEVPGFLPPSSPFAFFFYISINSNF